MAESDKDRRVDDGHFGALVRLLGSAADRRTALRAAAAPGLGGLLAMLGLGAAGARGKKKKGKKGKGQKERCRRVSQTCASDEVCCDGLFCLPSNLDPDRCCRQERQPCQLEARHECCTGTCTNGQCACRPNLELCEASFQCCSGNCAVTTSGFRCLI